MDHKITSDILHAAGALLLLTAVVAPHAAEAGDIGVHWDFVPNLNDGAITVDWDPTGGGVWHWLRNPNSSTASTLPTFWTQDYIPEPALQTMDQAQLWLVLLPSTSITIRLVAFRDGFDIYQVIKEQWFAWPGYGWVTMRIGLTEELRDTAADTWYNEVSTGLGHHLGIQIIGQADVRRATLTIQ